jgi:hypothetical protein
MIMTNKFEVHFLLLLFELNMEKMVLMEEEEELCLFIQVLVYMNLLLQLLHHRVVLEI